MTNTIGLLRGRQTYHLYRLTVTHPAIVFYGSGKADGIRLMVSIARIVQPNSKLTLEELSNPLGKHRNPWSCTLVDRSRGTGRKERPYIGLAPETLGRVDVMYGIGHTLTEKQKAQTYRFIFEKFGRINGMDLAPLLELVFLDRVELPYGVEQAKKKRRLGRPRNKVKKPRQPYHESYWADEKHHVKENS